MTNLEKKKPGNIHFPLAVGYLSCHIRDQFIKEARTEIVNALTHEIARIKNEIYDEYKTWEKNLRNNIRQEVGQDIKQDIKQDIRQDIKQELYRELYRNVYNELFIKLTENLHKDGWEKIDHDIPLDLPDGVLSEASLLSPPTRSPVNNSSPMGSSTGSPTLPDTSC